MNVGAIPYDFIQQRTGLSWNELKFGLERQLLSPKAAIDKALEQISTPGLSSPDALDLAGLSDSDPVLELVRRLADTEKPPSEESLKSKWLFLVLSWLYENRDGLVDPLKLVEEVYADFDYPTGVAPFVRYMPMAGPNLGNREKNEARLFDYWKRYLNSAAAIFRTQSDKTNR